MAQILVVDDDYITNKMLSLRLELQQHSVDTAFEGLQGFEMAKATDYDAILLDMEMPDINGKDVACRLRNTNYHGLIIAVTASVLAEETKAAIEAGCNYFIPKPIEDDFESRVETYIDAFCNKTSQ